MREEWSYYERSSYELDCFEYGANKKETHLILSERHPLENSLSPLRKEQFNMPLALDLHLARDDESPSQPRDRHVCRILTIAVGTPQASGTLSRFQLETCPSDPQPFIPALNTHPGRSTPLLLLYSACFPSPHRPLGRRLKSWNVPPVPSKSLGNQWSGFPSYTAPSTPL